MQVAASGSGKSGESPGLSCVASTLKAGAGGPLELHSKSEACALSLARLHKQPGLHPASDIPA